MPQGYSPLDGGASIRDSRLTLNNNFDAVASNFSGTSFPAVNLTLGMPCFRSDEKKLYELTDVAAKTWSLVRDFNININTEFFYRGSIASTAMDSAVNAGTYSVSYAGSHATTLMVIQAPGSTGTVQIEIGYGDTGFMKIRNFTDNNRWSSWRAMWTSGTDGAGSGLDADLLDGFQASAARAANTVPVRDANGKIAADLAGKADTAGRADSSASADNAANAAKAGDADKLGGFSVSATPAPSTIPVRDATGKIPGTVASADTAARANTAGTADTATRANTAGAADTATRANTAGTADTATRANTAGAADTATWATNIQWAGVHGKPAIYPNCGLENCFQTSNCNCNCDCGRC